MTILTKRERVDAALHNEPVDRPPVAAWRHFIPEERAALPLAEAHLRFFQEYDWDWLKANPRATYYAEIWGARYDYDDYQGVLPRLVEGVVRTPADLARITPQGLDNPALAEQLEFVRLIRAGIGDAHFVQTVFSPLSVLLFLLARPEDPRGDERLALQLERLRSLLQHHQEVVHTALDAITTTLANYAAASVAAGASGIFFAIVRLARAEALSAEEHTTFGLPYDLRVLEAVQEASFNILHICGPRVYFDQALHYPVHALNWAAAGQDNPTLIEARGLTDKALIGGVDEHGALAHGAPDAVIAEAQATLARAGQAGVLLAPGCGLELDTPAANLHALRQAIEIEPVPQLV